MNILLIVEGKTELDLFKYILPKYGFNEIIIEEVICKSKDFSNYNFSNTKDNVIVIEGPKNRIKDIVKNLKDIDDFYRNFVHPSIKFAGIFLIYDVDHNSNDIIREGFSKLNDESFGMLLLNCPCVEVFSDVQQQEFECNHLKEYKIYLNNYHSTNNNISSSDYIKMNFNDILIRFLEKNYSDFKSSNQNWEPDNIMNHPEYLIELNERYNIRTCNNKDEYYCKIRYFSTVFYVFIAFVNGFSKNFESYYELLNYLYKIKNKEEIEEIGHITRLVDSNTYSEKEFADSTNDRILAKKIYRKMEQENIISKREKGKKRRFLVSKYIKD